MPEPIIYVDISEVREGKLAELKAGMNALAEFVEANEPRILAYNVYFNEDGTRMTVVHVHDDSASLAFHMKVAGPEFPKAAPFINMVAIDVYGEVTDAIVEQLRQKARTLGSGTVRVHARHAGFARLGNG